jgi:hypothetical protein
MKAKNGTVAAQRNTVKRLGVWALFVAAVLSIPLLAKFPWTASDFLLAGSVLFGAALGFELATKNTRDTNARVIIGGATIIMVLFIWALAVVD